MRITSDMNVTHIHTLGVCRGPKSKTEIQKMKLYKYIVGPLSIWPE